MSYSAYTLCINMTRSIRSTGSQLRLILALVFAVLALAQNVAHAQEAYAVGFQSTLVETGLASNAGVAVDTNGNVYIANFADNQIVVETYQSTGVYTASCIVGGAIGVPTPTVPCTGAVSTLLRPYGVAVDASFNVYIADTFNSRVLKETYVSPGVYTESVIMASGSNPYISSPTGIAMDKNGNLYVTDPYTFNVVQLVAPTFTTVNLVASNASTGLQAPWGVAVDSNLNIFVADDSSLGVVEIPSGCAFPAPGIGTACGTGTVSSIGTGVSSPKGVAVDAQNSVYIASTGNGTLFKETIQYTGSYAQSTLLTGLTLVDGLAVDPNYNIYISLPNPGNKVEELSPVSGNFGEVSIGSTSATMTLTFSFLSAGTIGNILAVEKGATGQDFNLVTGTGAGTCAVGTAYALGATCTVNVTFTPLYAGTRYGAVELMNADTTPALFATAYIYGTGEGPQVIFLPGIQNNIYGNFGTAATVGVDGNDNIFVGSQTITTAYEYTAASGYTNAIALPGTYPLITDMNVDGAGNVYLTSWSTGVCYKLIAADGFQSVIAIDTGIANPTGSAVDGDGNVFVSSQAANGYVDEVLADSDYTIITKIYTGTTPIADLAIDGAGDVYDLNFSIGTVSEIMAVDGEIPANPTVNTILTGLTTGYYGLESIKVDNVGNVYIADWNTNSVTEYYVSGGFSTANSAVVFPFTAASDMAIDGQGNLWASSGNLDYIGWLTTANQDPLYFYAADGSTSAAQNVYVKNIGNQLLTFPDTHPPNPSISNYFAWSSSGTTVLDGITYNNCPVATSSPQTLSIDGICGFPITFSPTVLAGTGAIDGSLVLTDNAGIYTGTTTQTVLLYGNATGPIMTVTADSYYMGTNGPVPSLYYTENGVLGDAVCSGTPALTTSPAPGSAPYTPGAYPITITAGNFSCTGYSQIVFVNGTLTVGKIPALLTLTTQNATIPYGQAIPALTYTLTGWQGTDTQASACTGAPSITTVANNGSAPGTYTITGDVGTLVCSSANYNYSITVVNNGILTITKATPTISWAPNPTIIDPASTGLVAGQLDAIAMNSVTNVSAYGSFVYTYHNGTTNPVVTAGSVLPLGNDLICVVWTPSAGFASDFNATAAPVANCVTITVSNSPVLTITAGNVSSVYGATPGYTYAASPSTLPAGCTVGAGGVSYTLSPLAVFSPIPVSTPTYSILPGNVTCTVASGYVVSFVSGTLTVTQDTPTLAYTVASVPDGTALSAVGKTVTNLNSGAVVNLGGTFTYTYKTLTPVLGSTTSELGTFTPPEGTGTLCETWTPSTTIDVAGTLSYASQYNPTGPTCETLTVTSINLSITAGNTAITYGATPPAYTYVAVPSTFPTGCTGTVTYSLSPVPAYSPDPVASYSIIPAGVTCTPASGNTVSFTNGTLTVSQDTPILTYAANTLAFGAALSTITNTVTNSNNATDITANGTYTYTWGGVSEPATFTPPAGTAQLCEIWTPGINIIVGTLSYASQYNHTALTCENVTVSATAINVTGVATPSAGITYGGATPTFGYTSTPATLPPICGTPTITVTPAQDTPAQVGTFTITPSGLTCGSNYTVTYTPGSWVVSKNTPALTYTGGNTQTISYGATAGSITSAVTNSNNATNITADGTITYFWNGTNEGSGAAGAAFLPTGTGGGTGQLCEVWAPSASIIVPGNGSAYSTQYNSTASTCVTLTVNAVSPTITYTPTPTPITYGTTLVASQLTTAVVVMNGATVVTADGTSAFTYLGNPVVVGTVLPGGTDSICATWTPSAGFVNDFSPATICSNITVNKATVTLTYAPAPTPITYGTAIVAGQLDGVAKNGATVVTPDGTSSYTYLGNPVVLGTILPAGTDSVCFAWVPTAGFASDFNTPAPVCSNIVVNKAALSVTATVTSPITYGATPNPGYTSPTTPFPAACSPVTYTYAPALDSPYAQVQNHFVITPVVAAGCAANYTVTANTVNLIVNQDVATVSITGGTLPNLPSGTLISALTYAAVNSNVPTTVVTGGGNWTYTYNTGSGAVAELATYPIANSGTLCAIWTPTATAIPGTVPSLNYNTEYVASTSCVAITSTVTVTAGSPAAITYGAAQPAFSYVTVPSTLPAGCTVQAGGVTYTLNPLPGFSPDPVNAYTITPAGINCTKNTVNYVAGNWTVNMDTPIVSVPTTPIAYGATLGSIAVTAANSNSPFTPVTGGGTFTYTWNGTPELASYVPPAGSGTLCAIWTPSGSNIPSTSLPYSSEYNSSVSTCSATPITVTPTPGTLTLTVTNQTILYGATPNVSGDYTLTGFINDDSQGTACTGSPSITTLAVAGSPVGTYNINGAIGLLVCNLDVDTHYTINIVSPGTLTIAPLPATLTLTVTNQTITYGTTPNVANDYTLTGFVNRDTQATACTGAPSITTLATNVSPVGTYNIDGAVAPMTCTNDPDIIYSYTVITPGTLTIIDDTGTGSAPINFGSIPVGTTSGPQTATFTINLAGVIGVPQVLTTGITGLDFEATGGTCISNGTGFVYPAGGTCTVTVTFTPEYPGERLGSINLMDGDGNVISTVALSGVGTGPLTIFTTPSGSTNVPATVTPVGSGFTKPAGVVTDANDNIFVTDQTAGTVTEEYASTGYTTSKVLATGLSSPAGIVIDGAGNLFVADSGHDAVKEIVADGGYTTINTIYPSSSAPGGIAIDGAGDLFITYPANSAAPVVELTAASSYATSNVYGSGKFTNAGGIALDDAGNLYVTDTGNGQLDELTGPSYATVTPLATGLTAPTGLAIDSNGNAYINQTGSTSVTLLTASTSYATATNLGSITGGLTFGLALDGEGNLVTMDGVSNAVEKLNFSVAPTLTFAATPFLSTSSDSPQTVSLFNYGNLPLNLALAPSITTNFTLASGTSPECPSSAGSVNASTSCTLPVSFTPTVPDVVTGQLVLTDNNLNVSNATQTINLNGTITAVTPTITWNPLPNPIVYGTPITTQNSGALAFVGATNVTGDGSFSYTYNGNPITNGEILPQGSGSMCAIFTPSNDDLASNSLCVPFTVSLAPLTITAQNNATSVYGTTPNALAFTYVITGFVSPDGSGTLTDGTGNQSFGGSNVVCSGSGPSLSTPATNQSNVGIYTINVSTTGFTCNGYYFVINTGELHVTPVVVTIVPSPINIPYGSLVSASPFSYTCSVGGVPVANCSTAYPATGAPTITTSAVSRASSTPGDVYYTSNVGQYSMKSAVGSLQAPIILPAPFYANYSFVGETVANALTITTSPQVLNVQPKNVTVTQASCLSTSGPVLTYTLTGLINWDTVASTTSGAPVLSVPAAAQSCIKGTYTNGINGITAAVGTLALDQYLVNGVEKTDYTSPITATGTGTLIIY